MENNSERVFTLLDRILDEKGYMRQNIEAGLEHPVLMPWGEDRRAVANATMQAAIAAAH